LEEVSVSNITGEVVAVLSDLDGCRYTRSDTIKPGEMGRN